MALRKNIDPPTDLSSDALEWCSTLFRHFLWNGPRGTHFSKHIPKKRTGGMQWLKWEGRLLAHRQQKSQLIHQLQHKMLFKIICHKIIMGGKKMVMGCILINNFILLLAVDCYPAGIFLWHFKTPASIQLQAYATVQCFSLVPRQCLWLVLPSVPSTLPVLLGRGANRYNEVYWHFCQFQCWYNEGFHASGRELVK